MKKLIPEFDQSVYGAYMIKHVPSNRVYISYGELSFAIRYEVMMLRLGIHSSEELQKAYNENDNIQFINTQTSDNMTEAAEIGNELLGMFLETESSARKLFNVNKEISPVNTIFINAFVESIYDASKFPANIYDEFCVYTLYNPHTKAFYIGSGDRGTREYRHFKTLKDGKHGNSKLQKAYDQDDRFEFFWVPIQTRKEAYAFEQNLIDHFWGTPSLLNMSSVVGWSDGMSGKKHTDETKAKISISSKEQWNQPGRREKKSQQSTDWWKGLSEEELSLIAERQRETTSKLWENETYRNNVLEGMKRSWTDERKVIFAEVSKSRMNDPEMKKKYSEMTKNNWNDTEYRNKVTRGIKAYSNRDDVRHARSESAKKHSSRPEVIKARVDGIKKRFEDPEYRSNNKDRMDSYNRDRAKSITINGMTYSSIHDASRLTGHSRTFIKKQIAKGIYFYC